LFKDHGWDVVAFDNMTKFEYSRIPYFDVGKVREYNADMLEAIGVEVDMEDIRDTQVLYDAAYGCNLVVHCAAQPAMTIAIENPQLDLEVNVQGTLNVLAVCKYKDIPMANCSTVHVYGTGRNATLYQNGERFYLGKGDGTISEDGGIMGGKLTPLHASKRAAEIYVQAYTDTYRIQAANFRLTGIYGPRQFGGEDHGWVANFAIRTVLGLPIKIFGTDKQVRDILYVKDAASAFLKWYEAGCPPGTYNVGGGVACVTSLRGCLDILRNVTGKEQEITIEPPRQGDMYYFCCDTRHARESFGWAPVVFPQTGIRELVKWIEDNKEVFK